ncbi:type II toxin-antitoxin system PemK/MazF family toxin [Nocardioides terrisoli]|uniref:type II toxin-antitoxin system PemK/MazF family toxin n=1 Tax=Nocardioides terrisoli TaxID=3388267 RepID=UPI00287B7571|nr:type II toxin-antitoxin system PemK/MazF family toxin [Nocardioides marmorisolisilvae]
MDGWVEAGRVVVASGRGSPGSHNQPLRAATRREALPARRTNVTEHEPMRLPRIRPVRPVLPRWRPSYSPVKDGSPDPGEVVWAWVPYEDDPEQGKDRPVLVIARDGAELVALQLTSKDHDRDADQEARAGRIWMDVGSGPWDRRRRPSEVRLNRVLRLDPAAVRREGAALDPDVFQRVVDAAAPYLGG